MIQIYMQRLLSGRPITPSQGYKGDAGWDLYCSREQDLPPNMETEVHTDIAIAIPEGWCGLIKSRSSTADLHGLIVLEGIVDCGYRGELFVQVLNPLGVEVPIIMGTRLAQILFLPVPLVTWNEVSALPSSYRGQRGFGSSGR